MAIFNGTPGNDTLPPLGTDNSGDDQFFGQDGDDVLNGGSGDDELDAGNGNDALFGEVGSDILNGGADNDILNGGADNDSLDGGGGDDSLDGGTGADTMVGNIGNDTYYVDNTGDNPIENSSDDGTDLVNSSVNFTLGTHFENLTLLGSANLSATGNELANTLTGNGGANVLAGRGGGDTLTGLGGTDTFSGSVDELAGDTITDFSSGEQIIVSNADLSSLNGQAAISTLTLAAGKVLTLNNLPAGLLWQANFVAGTGTTLTLASSVNAGPVVANPASDTSVQEDTPWSYTLPTNIFSDLNGDPLTLSGVLAGGAALPSWLTFDAATRTFTGTPPVNFTGTLDLAVVASDGVSSVADTFTLTVTPVNDPPVLLPPGGGTSVTVLENKTAVTTLTASDPDSDPISYSLSGADSAFFQFDSATGALSFITAPDFEAPVDANGDNIYEVTVQASDGILTSQQNLLVAVGDEPGVTIRGSIRSDIIDSGRSARAQPLPTNEADNIWGGRGDDHISALGGNDVIDGDYGRDVMEGGGGRDRFDFNSILDSSPARPDAILDFVRGQDLIDVSTIDAVFRGANNAFKIGDDVQRMGYIDIDRISEGKVRVECYTDRDTRPEMVIIVNGVNELSASDFIL